MKLNLANEEGTAQEHLRQRQAQALKRIKDRDIVSRHRPFRIGALLYEIIVIGTGL
jgi:hypothetical protein